jgi:hypothetical protein
MSDKSTSASGKYFIFDTNIWIKTNLLQSSVGSALILNIDLASAKPHGFVTGDGWFIYNLITNLADR